MSYLTEPPTGVVTLPIVHIPGAPLVVFPPPLPPAAPVAPLAPVVLPPSVVESLEAVFSGIENVFKTIYKFYFRKRESLVFDK